MLPYYPKTRIFWKAEKKIIQKAKTQKFLEIAKISITPFNQRSLIYREAWFWPCFGRKISQKKKIFVFGNFRPLPNKNVQIWDHFFPLLFPKDSGSLKILDIQFQEVGAKRHLNGTLKVDSHSDTQTHRRTNQLLENIGPGGRCFESGLKLIVE